MDHGVERRGRLYDFVECAGSGDVGHDAKVELGAVVWEIGEDLLGFGLAADDASN